MNRPRAFFVLASVALLPSLSLAASKKPSVGAQESFDELYSDPSHAIDGDSLVHPKDVAGSEIARRSDDNAGSVASKVRLVKIRDLLKDVPPAERAEFMGHLRLLDGKVVSAYLAPLRKTMSDSRIRSILDQLSGSSSDASSAATDRSHRHLVDLSDALKGLPQDVRDATYESMIFRDGELVSFWVGGLRHAFTGPKLQEILASLGQAPVASGAVDTKGLCGNGWCDNSICDFPPSGPLRCLSSDDDYVCKTNCK